MATPEEQITPADAAIVTTGTGRKGPEEHDLPESLKYDMDLCLEILRNVLGEYNPELLSTFDTVRHYAVEASAEHFAELKDPNPDQDGLKEAVNVIDNMTLHDAQLLARAFATYFHLANLSEENYRVSVLHERENNVSVDQAVDPINELTVAYHQLINETGPAKAKELLNQLEFHPVFTAHPTEARRKAVEGKIRRVSELLEEYKRLGGSDKKECLRRLYNEIDALFRTSPIALKKPTPVEEADTILDIFDNTLFNTIPKVYRRFDDWVLGDKAGLVEPACPAFFHPGSWIGSDRDGNPNVTAKVSRAVARKFSDHVIAALEQATRTVGRNLTMEAETTPPSAELKSLWSHQKEMSERLTDKAALISTKEMHRAVMLVMADRLHYTIERDADLMYHSCDDFLADLKVVQRSLAAAGAKRSAYGPLQDLDLADRDLRLPHGGDGVPSALRGARPRPCGYPRARPARRARRTAADDARGARHLPRPRCHPEAQRPQGRPPLHHLLHQERPEHQGCLRAQPLGLLPPGGRAHHRRDPAVRAA